MEMYKCHANISGNSINYREGEMITQETYDKLPERLKIKFKKLSENAQFLSDGEVRKLLLELREKVGAIEAKFSKTKN